MIRTPHLIVLGALGTLAACASHAVKSDVAATPVAAACAGAPVDFTPVASITALAPVEVGVPAAISDETTEPVATTPEPAEIDPAPEPATQKTFERRTSRLTPNTKRRLGALLRYLSPEDLAAVVDAIGSDADAEDATNEERKARGKALHARILELGA